MDMERLDNVKNLSLSLLIKEGVRRILALLAAPVSGIIRLAPAIIAMGCIFYPVSVVYAADLYPGNGWASTTSAADNWVPIPLLVSPAEGATGVSQSPSLQ